MTSSTLPQKPIRVVIADDHALIRGGIRLLLERLEGIQVIDEVGDGRSALALLETEQPDILLTDIAMPGLNGIETIDRITQKGLDIKVIVLSMHSNEEYVQKALTAGAKGYLVKGADPLELELAIRAVARGELYLSPAVSKPLIDGFLQHQQGHSEKNRELTSRQREILQLIAEGQSSKNIATILGLSVKTIDSHRTELMNRLGIHEVAGLVRYAIRQGVISSES